LALEQKNCPRTKTALEKRQTHHIFEATFISFVHKIRMVVEKRNNAFSYGYFLVKPLVHIIVSSLGDA